MYWLRPKWKIIVCAILAIAFIGVLRGCAGSSPIIGTATIIDFSYGVYSGNVSFRTIVVGYTVYGEKVVRRWLISSSQFQQLTIGDSVVRIGGRVILLE